MKFVEKARKVEVKMETTEGKIKELTEKLDSFFKEH